MAEDFVHLKSLPAAPRQDTEDPVVIAVRLHDDSGLWTRPVLLDGGADPTENPDVPTKLHEFVVELLAQEHLSFVLADEGPVLAADITELTTYLHPRDKDQLYL